MQKRAWAVTILTLVVLADHKLMSWPKEIFLYLISRYPCRPIFISFLNTTSFLITLKCIPYHLSTLCKKGTARNLKFLSI